VDGIDYHFRTKEEFEQLIAEGAFLEHKEVFGNYYGTPLKQLEHMLEEGKIAVLKIDVQGALTAIDLRPDATTIFIMPPSMEELDRRIRARATESHEDIERRLAVAHQEISTSSRYRHRVINDDVETVVQQLEDIVRSGI
jgi:guanylate kinase